MTGLDAIRARYAALATYGDVLEVLPRGGAAQAAAATASIDAMGRVIADIPRLLAALDAVERLCVSAERAHRHAEDSMGSLLNDPSIPITHVRAVIADALKDGETP